MHILEQLTAGIVASAFVLATSPAIAGQGRGGGPKTQPVKASGSTHVSGPKASPAPKIQGGKSTTSHGPKSTTTVAKAPKTTSPHSMKGAAAGGKKVTSAGSKTTGAAGKGSSSASAKAKKTTTTTTTTTASSTKTTTSGTGTTVQLTPVQEKLQKNTNLASKLESRLPKGTDLMLAAEGFRNLGQFVAAVNVSNNLNIDFVQLKTSMVDDGLSLGQSIQKLRPTADATREASLAESQATTFLNTTTSSTSTSSTTPTTTTSTTKKPAKTSGGAR